MSSGSSVLSAMAIPLFLLAMFTILFALRSMAPRGLMKIGISMLQIVSSANSVYDIPWVGCGQLQVGHTSMVEWKGCGWEELFCDVPVSPCVAAT